MTLDEILNVLAITQPRTDGGHDEVLRAAQTLAEAGGFVVAVVGACDPEETARVASLRQAGTTGLALVLDATTFGPAPDADEAGPHTDTLRLAGWRAITVRRDDEIGPVWDRLTAAVVGGGR
jgi:hypothetical protein